MSESTGAPTTGASQTDKNRYRQTLNLPQTSFPMKANLVQNEPASLKRWAKMDLYQRIREARAGREKYIFHDGPPYANGSIHLGHLMNKCLKDFVVRTRTMMGFDCPFVPGWDCHGLPIEHKVMTELVESGKIEKLRSLDEDTRRMAVRRECRKYAEKFHKLHTEQMTRLLTLADYKDPYLTMQPTYEGATLEVLASLLEQGLVYRALKPVHWSIENETALAEAELEYDDREDTSVYVDFEAVDAAAVYDAFGLGAGDRPEQTPSFMIWTTTPWTLPANLAVAVRADIEYALVRIDGNITVLARRLVEAVTKAAGSEQVEVLATAFGDALVGLKYRQPLLDAAPTFGEQCRVGDAVWDLDKLWSVVEADYVTTEDGTGLVHTAPGHGAEDYGTGLAEGLPVYCPVLADGTYDDTVAQWLRGMSIWKANDAITEHLRSSGHLYFDQKFMHSYPHDWRSKTPVIFRCTEQWFVGVDVRTKRDGKALRELALAAIDTGVGGDERVRFVPAWGRNRMRGMLESRPDWCVSRQRAWGLPIPAFFAPSGESLMTAASTRAVAQQVRAHGSDYWFSATAEELLKGYDPAQDPDAPQGLKQADLATLRKGQDIFDVWFESGSSWNAVMRERLGDAGFPVELYLEGSDQHRGWFQLSLLPSLGMMGRAPYRTIVTHGFMNDKDGRKLSKSKGDTIEELFRKYGSDVLRWWVSSLSYENDVKVDDEFFRLAGESYRKVRNTLRFLLSNLDDFDPAKDRVEPGAFTPTSIDAWVLGAYERVAQTVVAAYERYDFRSAHSALYDFCNETLSATYLAAVKDRLYCDRADSPRRRRTQTAMWNLADGLVRLLAPVLCHTADEALRAMRKTPDGDTSVTVHTEEFITSFDISADDGWKQVMSARDAALTAIERARADSGDGALGVDNPLDLGVTMPDPDGTLGRFDSVDLADLLGVSRVELDASAKAPVVRDLTGEPRCERSWKRDGTVRQRSDGGMLSDRDAEAVGVA
ncbi:MAG: isoleucine--tRNA ligase [Phycisphaerales bacterium JB039]